MGFNLPPSVFFLSFLCFIPFPSFHFLFCFVCLFVFVFGQVTIGIGDEVRRQNRLLDDMSGSFEDTGTLLGISMRKVKSLTNAGGTKLMCYIVAFAVAVFFVIYFLMK